MWEIKLRVCDSFVWKTLFFLDGNGGDVLFFVWNPSWKIQSSHFLSP